MHFENVFDDVEKARTNSRNLENMFGICKFYIDNRFDAWLIKSTNTT